MVRWFSHGLVVLAVAACASPDTVLVTEFDKPGLSPAEERVDWGLCGGRYNATGTGEIVVSEDQDVEACMREKGYTSVRKVIHLNELGFDASHRTPEEQRLDWELCGGRFGPDGQWLRPADFESARACMVEDKGYFYKR